MDFLKHRIKSFARVKGHMTQGQRQAFSSNQPYLVDYQEKIVNGQELFGDNRPIMMEIGFGMGKATVQIAQENPHYGYLAVDVYQAGIGKLLMEINDKKIDNIRIIGHDVVDVMNEMIMPGSLQGIHIFFPDPWPKTKHHKRRLLKSSFISYLARALATDGYLYIVTDWENYAKEILQCLTEELSLTNYYDGYAEAQKWRPKTKFELKGKEKEHCIYELFFHKKANDV